MYKYLNKVLRIPYHTISISYDNGDSFRPITKAWLKKRVKDFKFLYRVYKIETQNKYNTTQVYIRPINN